MDRETFLARAVKTMEVTLDDDSVIKIRKLTQADVETMTEKYSTGAVLKQLEGLRYIVSRVVVNDNGERMFTDADLKGVIKEMDTDVVQKIAKEACRFSGLKTTEGEVDPEADAKND